MSNLYLAAVAAFVTCPCHLVVVMPLLLGLTAGTAVGAFLVRYQTWVYGLSAGLFIVSLALAVSWWSADERESVECCPIKPDVEQNISSDGVVSVLVQERQA